MEDGLLVSHHLAVSHCQGVIASLQVKILKCQLDHLDNRGDIAERTINDRRLNAPVAEERPLPICDFLSLFPLICHLSISSEYLSSSFPYPGTVCTSCVYCMLYIFVLAMSVYFLSCKYSHIFCLHELSA